MMGLAYIRDYYGVPAKRGEPVERAGKRGYVTGASGPHVRVRFEGEKRSRIYHPTDLRWINMWLEGND